MTPPVDRKALHDELERARTTFHELLAAASPAALRRRTNGTRWTNEQLLFHMLFGYLIARTLLMMVRIVSRLPAPVGRGNARLLNSPIRLFDSVNYLGSCLGAKIINHRRMGVVLDRTISSLQRHLAKEKEAELNRSMPFPDRWDPFFHETMTRADLYHYGTQHFDFHRRQLTVTGPESN